MSIGFFLENNAAVVWRGPMLHKAIQQFLEDVAWGELDYLLLDLPPGTGDVSMTLAQLLPQARVLVVTTPQPAAQTVAKRAADMAAKVDLELLGVIENMSGFTTPSGERFTIFGEGGGQQLADELDVPAPRQGAALRGAARARRCRHAAGSLRARRPRIHRDPPGRPRHRLDDSAGAPGDAGRGAGGAGAGPDRRHRAAGRPSPRLNARGRALRTQPGLVGRARRRARRAATSTTSGGFARAARRCGRSRSTRSATSPASGSRTCNAISASIRCPGLAPGRRSSVSTSPGRPSTRRTSLPPRPASTRASSSRTSTTPSTRSATSASTSSTPASARSTGCPTCRAGRRLSPSCSSPADSST